MEGVPEDLVSEANFFAFEKTFFKVSVQNFVFVLLDIIGLENFPLSFSNSQSRITMCKMHWCYTSTTLLSANQNRESFHVYY